MSTLIAPRGISHRTVREAVARRPVLVLLAVFIVFYLLSAIVDHSLLTMQGARGVLLLACPLALLAGAQTICLLTGGIDMSVSMVATLSAYFVVDQMGGGAAWAIIAGILVGMLAGAVNGIGVGVFRVSPIIMTLGVQSVLLGLITVGAGASGFLDSSRGLPSQITRLARGSIGPLPANFALLLAVAILLVFTLSRTGLGRNVYGVGDNPVASRLAGVRVWQVIIATYVIAGMLSAAGGMLIGGMNGAVGPDMSNVYLLPSIAAAVVGGTSVMGGSGGFGGTIVGALILTVLNRLLLTFNINDAMQQFVYGFIVLALAWTYRRLTGPRAGGA